VLKVTGVRSDGTALGTMGGSLDVQRKAEIKVDGSRGRIATAVGSVIDVARKPDGTLAGTWTRQDGTPRPITLTRMQRCMSDPVPAGGQAYEVPKYCVGDTWTFTGGRVQRVLQVDGGSMVMTGYPMLGGTPCAGCVFELDENLSLRSIRLPDGSPQDVSRGFMPVGEQWQFWDFPLTVGKSWRVSARAFLVNQPRVYTVDCSVQGYEDVKTQAGTLKAFRIFRKWHQEAPMLGSADWSDTMWFAPGVKTMVKFEQSSGPNSWELASYDLKEFVATYRRPWLSEQALRAKGFVPMTQQQLKERYARRVDARYEASIGTLGTLSVMPDGAVRFRGAIEETGTWRIKDGKFCTMYPRFRQGAEACYRLYRTGDWEVSSFQLDSPVIRVWMDVD